jgi:NAD(P)-dependent dehydrogenase (short-subunit alcohol dehydrogenase family)
VGANVRAPMLLTKLALPSLLATQGAIINISSGAAGHPPHRDPFLPDPPRFHAGPEYAMTKAALDRFTTDIAQTLAADGVAAISIWPGFTLTERNAAREFPGIDMTTAQPMSTTAKAVAFVCADPMAHSGRVLVAKDVVAAKDL